MKNNLTITIVTPSYNQAEFIEETIASILSQEGDFFLDYIIMDGGSTDDSVDIIKKYESLLSSGEWPVKCRGIEYRWVSARDGGQSDAINKGFAKARGEILGWLNSDDLYYPGTLQRVAELDWQKTDLCYGKGMWISRFGDEILSYPVFPPDKYALYCECTLCQPAVFFSRAMYSRVGALSTRYHCAFDYEYWMRTAMSGVRTQYIPELLAKSRMYAQNKSASLDATVGRESAEIKAIHYKGIKLNPLRLLASRAIVSTVSRIKIRIVRYRADA